MKNPNEPSLLELNDLWEAPVETNELDELSQTIVNKFGVAYISGTQTTVWQIERFRRLGATIDDIQQVYPALDKEHILEAFEYAKNNADEVNNCIAENYI